MADRPLRWDQVAAGLRGQVDALVAAAPHLLSDPTAATRLPGCGAGALWGRAQQTLAELAVEVAAARPRQAGDRTATLLDWVGTAPLDTSAAAAGPSADALRAAWEAVLAGVAGTAVPDTAVVTTRRGAVLLPVLGLARLVALVVHARDFRPAAPVPRAAEALVVRALARLAAARHPGHSVELRVPPHAAVQLLAGPRHTRGTPPTVVEATPDAFLDVAVGRRTVSGLPAGGWRASGERADLPGVFPLLP